MPPTVAVILPTFNRADLLPGVLDCLKAQTFRDWELVVVDDGSTDATRGVVDQFAAQTTNPVRYLYQENQGAGVARNRGVNEARGEFVAFFDSDDAVLSHHLRDCVDVLTKHPEVDWVYADSRNVEARTGRVLDESIFRENGRERQFTRLRCRTEGKLHIFDDPGLVRCAIDHGIWAKFQTSVFRRNVFTKISIPPFRIAEDVAFELMALSSGVRPAYLDHVHIEYRLHEGNVSTPLGVSDFTRRLEKFHTVYRSLEYVLGRAPLRSAEDRTLRRRLAAMQFYTLGYGMHWMNGQTREAFKAFHRAIRLYPYDWRFWKTCLVSRIKCGLGIGPRPSPALSLRGADRP